MLLVTGVATSAFGLMPAVDVVMAEAEAAVMQPRLTSVVSTPRQIRVLDACSDEVGASEVDSLSDNNPPQPPMSSADDEAQLVFDSEVVFSACISHICSCRMSSW